MLSQIKKQKRIYCAGLSVLLVILFLATSVNCAYASITAADFTDVKEDYWGYSYIDYTAKVGIIEGYPAEDGTRTFCPENEVSKQEAITMVVNTAIHAGLGYVNADYTEKWTEKLEAAGLDPWAYSYAAYGLEKRFLTEEELMRFMVSSGNSEKATREEVFSWIARALWSKYKGLEDKLFVLTYTDADQVAEERTTYIGLLSNLGILIGNDNGNGTYSLLPKSPIKRVEFAVICKKVYELVQSGKKPDAKTLLTGLDGPSYGAVSGVITQLTLRDDKPDAFTLCMTDENGIPYTVFAENTPCYYNGERIKEGFSLAKGTHAVVAHDEAGVLHIDTKMNVLTGQITNTRQPDALGNQRIAIRLTGDNTAVYFYLNSKQDGVSVSGRITSNKKATFLADGVNIVEIITK